MMVDVLNVRRMLVLMLTCITLAITPVVCAAVPEVVVISPPGVQRGTSTEITITGARLGDTKQLLFFTPGIEVTNVQSPADNIVKATVTVPADFPCDLHAFRVYTSSGLSNLRYLSVGALPVVNEVEPNSEFATPQAIAMNSTVHGVVLTEDVDYFSVDLKKGERLAVELEGLRLSYMYDFFDPFVAILDSKRFELARSDDMPLVQQDGVCSIVAPEDGKYIVEVRESSFGGNERALYRLHVGSFPRPMACIRLVVVQVKSWKLPVSIGMETVGSKWLRCPRPRRMSLGLGRNATDRSLLRRITCVFFRTPMCSKLPRTTIPPRCR